MAESQPFRFQDLPGEIRNKVYKILLCTFDPVSPSDTHWKSPSGWGVNVGLPTGICSASHSIETTILRTRREIHREAYDVMVKTNQFVQVESVGLAISQLLLPSQVPIVTMDRAHAEQFKGYILHVGLKTSALEAMGSDYDEEAYEDALADADRGIRDLPPPLGPVFNFMLLGRDWLAFCHALGNADPYVDAFSSDIKLTITVLPWKPADQMPDYKADISPFLTQKTQEHVLKPLRTLRGFINVTIGGAVDNDIADSVTKEVMRSKFTDPKAILEALNQTKELGNQYYRDNESARATQEWMKVVSDVRSMRSNWAWLGLIEEGGQSFINEVADIYFTVLLNGAQNWLKGMQADVSNRARVLSMGFNVSSTLQEASEVDDDFYDYGASWHPSDAQQAKLFYRMALCWRLVGDTNFTRHAVEFIDRADELAPGDPVIQREASEIYDWQTRSELQDLLDADMAELEDGEEE